jgi:hypothetical protein
VVNGLLGGGTGQVEADALPHIKEFQQRVHILHHNIQTLNHALLLAVEFRQRVHVLHHIIHYLNPILLLVEHIQQRVYVLHHNILLLAEEFRPVHVLYYNIQTLNL